MTVPIESIRGDTIYVEPAYVVAVIPPERIAISAGPAMQLLLLGGFRYVIADTTQNRINLGIGGEGREG